MSMLTNDKYYVRVDNDEKPVALYRLKAPFIAQLWKNGAWEKSDTLLGYLRDGFVDLDEVTEESAKEFAPEAFSVQ